MSPEPTLHCHSACIEGFPYVQDPLEPCDLEAEVDGMRQNDGGDSAARLAAETVKLPGAAEAELPDVESGPLLEAIEAAAAAASPVAPRLEGGVLERTATPEGVSQPARDVLPAATHRCARALVAVCRANGQTVEYDGLWCAAIIPTGSIVMTPCQVSEGVCLKFFGHVCSACIELAPSRLSWTGVLSAGVCLTQATAMDILHHSTVPG